MQPGALPETGERGPWLGGPPPDRDWCGARHRAPPRGQRAGRRARVREAEQHPGGRGSLRQGLRLRAQLPNGGAGQGEGDGWIRGLGRRRRVQGERRVCIRGCFAGVAEREEVQWREVGGVGVGAGEAGQSRGGTGRAAGSAEGRATAAEDDEGGSGMRRERPEDASWDRAGGSDSERLGSAAFYGAASREKKN